MTTPTNGTPPPKPAAPPNGTPAPAAQTPATPDYKTMYEQKQREDITNRRAAEAKLKNLTTAHETERKTFAEKLKDADAFARLRKLAPVDMGAAAKELWGDGWYEKLTTYQANGGAPSAASVQQAIEDARAQTRAELEADRKKANDDAQQAEQQRAEAQVRHFRGQLLNDAKAALEGKEFPVFAKFKSPEHLERSIFALINSHNESTAQRDESGNMLAPGQVLSFKEAAERLEADMLGIAEVAVGADKYKERFAPKLTAPKTPGTVQGVKSSQQSLPSQSSQGQSQQGRSTLNNDMTGSTPPAPPKYRSEEERKAAAIAAYEADLAARQR